MMTDVLFAYLIINSTKTAAQTLAHFLDGYIGKREPTRKHQDLLQRFFMRRFSPSL